MLHRKFLASKFGLKIDTHSSRDNALHGSGMAAEKREEKYILPVNGISASIKHN